MGSALRILGRSIADLYDELFLLVGVGVLWMVLCVPVITIVTASAGLYYVTYHLVRGEEVEFRLFWIGFRRYLLRSWQVLLPATVVTLVIVANIYFYTTQFNGWFQGFMVSMSIWALVSWLGVQVYTFPLLIHQENVHALMIFRNAILITLRHPLLTLSLLVSLLLAVVIGGVFTIPLILIVKPLISLIQSNALLTVIQHDLT